MGAARWETAFLPLTPHRGCPASAPVAQQLGTGGCLWMPGHPWVLGHEGHPGTGMLSGERGAGKALLLLPPQPGWDIPVPWASAASLGDITGHRAAETPVSPFAPFPETRGRGWRG